MNITVIAVGSLKEKYWTAAVSEYAKRIGAYAKLNIVEVPEEKPHGIGGEASNADILRKEGERILSKIDGKDFVVALAVDGSSLSSEALAHFIQKKMTLGVSEITFLIGGSLGLSPEALARADFRLSFSSFTFPHQLIRPLLLEQIYRSFKIMRGEPYHK